MCSSLGFKDVDGLQGSSAPPGFQVRLHRSGLADLPSCPRTCQAPGRIQTAETVPEHSSLRSAVPGDPTVEGGRVKGVGGCGREGWLPWETLRDKYRPPHPLPPATEPIDAIGSQGLLVRDASTSLLLCSKLCKTNSSSSCCLARTFKALFF